MSFLSTLQLCEQTCASLKTISIEDCLTVWHAIGKVVRTQLQANKGVRLGQLGTFTKATSGGTTFVPASEILKCYKLKAKPNPQPDSVPISGLNFTQLSQSSGVSREIAEKIYTRFVHCVGKSILEGREILLTIHKVAEISIKNSMMAVTFISQSNTTANVRQSAASPVESPKMKQRDSVWSANRQRAAARDRAAATQEAALAKVVAYKNKTAIPSPQFRPKNNIFSSDSDISHTTPPPVPVNPIVHHGEVEYEYNPFDEVKDYKTKKAIKAEYQVRPNSAVSVNSVDTMSLLHSPRSQLSVASSRQNSRRGYDRGGLSKEQLEYHTATTAIQPKNVKTRPASLQGGVGAALGALDARALAAKALSNGEIVQKVREKIIERGGTSGIRSLQRLLMIMDDNGDKRLTKDELKYGLRDYGIELNIRELDEIFLYFDRDRNGFVDITEFLVGIRGDLNESRKNIIHMAFDILDADGSGYVTVEEIADVYDVSQNPEVTSGKKTLREAQLEFMGQWELGEKDGVVTYEEFEDYYKEVSASIDGDDYFELMMRNAWRIAGGQGYAANTANLRVLVTQKDGTQKIATVEKELGLKQGDRDEIRARLAKQGVGADNIELYGGMDSTEKPKNARNGRSQPAARQRSQNAVPSKVSRPTNAAVSMRNKISRDFVDVSTSNKPSSANSKINDAGRVKKISNSVPPSGGKESADKFDAYDAIRKAIYDPPITMEEMGNKLMVSVVTFIPRITKGAFISRMQAINSSLTRSNIIAMWAVIDQNDAGSSEISKLHSMLSSRYGKDKTFKTQGVIERVIARIMTRCGQKSGIRGLQRTLMIMDDNGDKRLTKDELKYGLRDYGIELNIRELDEIFLYFDRDRNGFVDITEFLVGIRGDLNESRKNIIHMAFDILDADGSGYVTVEEIADVYDVSQNPEVTSGKKTLREAQLEFMGQWELGEKDGVVTYEEFEDYYKEVSASIDGDDYFELMMRNAWRIAGGQGYAANTANLRVLVTQKDGTQKIATVEKELGLKQGDRDEIRARLAKQGVGADNIELYGGMDSTERPKKNRNHANLGSKAALESKRGVDVGNPRNTYDRNVAALKLAAAFRGRVGRKKALAEKRKADASAKQAALEAADANRPRPKKLIRPVPKRKI